MKISAKVFVHIKCISFFVSIQFWPFNLLFFPEGVSIIVLERDGGSIHKATVTYWNSGIGVNVTGNGRTLAVGVTLPPTLRVRTITELFQNWVKG